MRAGTLREKIRTETRTSVSDGGGGFDDAWATTESGIFAGILAKSGSEKLLEERLKGVVVHEITVRYSDKTSSINSDMRIVNERSGAVYNIAAVLPDTRKRFIVITATTGTASG